MLVFAHLSLSLSLSPVQGTRLCLGATNLGDVSLPSSYASSRDIFILPREVTNCRRFSTVTVILSPSTSSRGRNGITFRVNRCIGATSEFNICLGLGEDRWTSGKTLDASCKRFSHISFCRISITPLGQLLSAKHEEPTCSLMARLCPRINVSSRRVMGMHASEPDRGDFFEGCRL